MSPGRRKRAGRKIKGPARGRSAGGTGVRASSKQGAARPRRRVLLALSSLRHSPEAVERALSHRPGELEALFVVEMDAAEELADRVSELGFLGEKAARDLRETLLETELRRGQNLLGQVAALASQRGIACQTEIRQGRFSDQVLARAAERGPSRIVLTRTRRSGLSRKIRGSEVDEVVRRAPCPVEVV